MKFFFNINVFILQKLNQGNPDNKFDSVISFWDYKYIKRLESKWTKYAFLIYLNF